MQIKNACYRILEQLTVLVTEITEKDFSRPCNTLNGGTVGQHLRHTLEFFICFREGYFEGIVNYDKRNHDKRMEIDKNLALNTISDINIFIEQISPEKIINLEVGYNLNENSFDVVESNAMRELVYNIEHAVHHMAIMKIALREIAPYIQLEKDFGVAASTLRFQESSH